MKLVQLLLCGALLGVTGCQTANGTVAAAAAELGPDPVGGALTYTLRDTIDAPGKATYPGSSAGINGAATVLTIGDHALDRVLTYTRRSGIWSAPELLEPGPVARNQGASSLSFTWQVQSADGNTLLVSDSGRSYGAGAGRYGAVVVHQKTASGWTVRETLNAPENTASFGYGIALNNNGSVVAAASASPSGATRIGRIYVYRRGEGSALVQSEIIERPQGASADFGVSLTMTGDGNWLAAGDKTAQTIPNFGQGAVFIFRYQSGAWTLASTVRPIRTLSTNYFANRIAFSADGSALAVGDDGLGPNRAGGVVVFTRPGAAWTTQPTSFTTVYSPEGAYVRNNPNARPTDLNVAFGTGVALSSNGRTLLVTDELAAKAYVYTR